MTLDVVSTGPITGVTITIEGRPVTVSGDGAAWRGSLTLPSDVAYIRAVTFTVDYTTAQGTTGSTVFTSNDGSVANLWNSKVQALGYHHQ